MSRGLPSIAGMDGRRVAAAVRELRGRAREPRVSIRRKLKLRGQVERSVLAARRPLCRWGLCAEFAETGGLCNTHDHRSRRALAKAPRREEGSTE